jgi:Tfp pilus assembly protein PilF/SAM-dependent methyltransferase
MNSAAVPQALTQAQVCWQRGDLIQAETLCRQILLRDRANASTYAVLASVLMQGGQIAQAEPVGRQWAAHCPGDAHAHAFLGHVLRELGHTEAAMRCWQHALRLPGEQGDLHYRLGRTLLDLGQDAQALAELAAAQCDAQVHEEALLWQIRVLHRLQRCDQARQLLGDALFRLSTTGQEGQIVKLWLALFPQDEVPNHRLAAQGGVAAPARASDAYVSYLFDHYADSFDVQLAKLHYRAPELIAGQLAQSLPSPQAHWRVLDAGCGTGLCGVWLRPYARELTGVDLSPGMVAKARARGGYDRLEVAELTQFLARKDAAFEHGSQKALHLFQLLCREIRWIDRVLGLVAQLGRQHGEALGWQCTADQIQIRGIRPEHGDALFVTGFKVLGSRFNRCKLGVGVRTSGLSFNHAHMVEIPRHGTRGAQLPFAKQHPHFRRGAIHVVGQAFNHHSHLMRSETLRKSRARSSPHQRLCPNPS